MSEQEEVPVWHAIVGDGWEPVQFGEITKADEHELFSKGWVLQRDNGFIYTENMRPRRRRKPVMFSVTVRDMDGKQTASGFLQSGQVYELDTLGQLFEVEDE